jgi:CelD/BcsL family acetyltransferase involved in cellulose biosynthesis/ribosomal protein S18 acetylase RimI-like enzyme
MPNIIQGAEAEEQLKDPRFLDQWTRLYQQCPWATPCQSPGFVNAWHDSYRDRYAPLIVSEFSPSGELTGLISLATEKSSGHVTVAGDRQAEYKTWLALPSNGSSFIQAALAQLQSGTSVSALSFRYLPPGTPTDWISQTGKRSWTCELEQHQRPIIPVGDTAALNDYLKKKKSGKSIRNSWNRLKRLGDLHLEQIQDVDHLVPVFDQLITYYDMRQGGSHGKFAFQQDPGKKPFHLAMMRVPGLLNVTILKAGQEILTAQFGIADGKVCSGAMPIINPFYASHSPMQVHLMMLLEKLQQDGYSIFDLTASMDPFKDRFVATFDSVHILSVYFRHRLKHQVMQSGQALARRSLRSLGIEPHAALQQWQQFASVPLGKLPAALAKNSVALLKRSRSDKQLRIYTLQPQNALPLNGSPEMNRDHMEDLLAFQPSEVLVTRQRFLSDSLRRIESGHHFYTRVENGRLVHCSWLIEEQKNNVFAETDQTFEFPAGSAVVYASYTAPEARGRGLCRSALQQMLHDLAQHNAVHHVYTAVPADNQPAIHLVEKLGFVKV